MFLSNYRPGKFMLKSCFLCSSEANLDYINVEVRLSHQIIVLGIAREPNRKINFPYLDP